MMKVFFDGAVTEMESMVYGASWLKRSDYKKGDKQIPFGNDSQEGNSTSKLEKAEGGWCRGWQGRWRDDECGNFIQ
jgi:hypothetical protein